MEYENQSAHNLLEVEITQYAFGHSTSQISVGWPPQTPPRMPNIE
jgi:hypothetical protein